MPAAWSSSPLRRAYTQLKDLARRQGVTLFMLLQGALAALLTKLGAGTDIPIGSAIAGRTEAALDRLVGFFVNTLVLRTDTSGDPSFTELLERVRGTCLEAYAHQDLPFERLVELLDPPRAFGRQPLFQTMLVLQNTAPPKARSAGRQACPLQAATRTTKFDLTFSFTETHDRASGWRPARRAGVQRRSVRSRFGRALGGYLSGCWSRSLRPPARSRGSRSWMEERRQLLHSFNDTAAPFAQTTLVDLFEQQVERTPENIALLFEREQLSYAELDARANRLAWQLIAEGIGPEDIVAICLERSIELIVAILAVLKSRRCLPAARSRLSRRAAGVPARRCAPRCVLTTSAASRMPRRRHGLCRSMMPRRRSLC